MKATALNEAISSTVIQSATLAVSSVPHEVWPRSSRPETCTRAAYPPVVSTATIASWASTENPNERVPAISPATAGSRSPSWRATGSATSASPSRPPIHSAEASRCSASKLIASHRSVAAAAAWLDSEKVSSPAVPNPRAAASCGSGPAVAGSGRPTAEGPAGTTLEASTGTVRVGTSKAPPAAASSRIRATSRAPVRLSSELTNRPGPVRISTTDRPLPRAAVSTSTIAVPSTPTPAQTAARRGSRPAIRVSTSPGIPAGVRPVSLRRTGRTTTHGNPTSPTSARAPPAARARPIAPAALGPVPELDCGVVNEVLALITANR